MVGGSATLKNVLVIIIIISTNFGSILWKTSLFQSAIDDQSWVKIPTMINNVRWESSPRLGWFFSQKHYPFQTTNPIVTPREKKTEIFQHAVNSHGWTSPRTLGCMLPKTEGKLAYLAKKSSTHKHWITHSFSCVFRWKGVVRQATLFFTQSTPPPRKTNMALENPPFEDVPSLKLT